MKPKSVEQFQKDMSRFCRGCGRAKTVCVCPTQGDENSLPPETQAALDAQLSVVQRQLVEYLKYWNNDPKGRVLHRFDGGFWASAKEKRGPVKRHGQTVRSEYRVPMRHWPTGTIEALAARGVLVAQKRQDGGGHLKWMDFTLAKEYLV